MSNSYFSEEESDIVNLKVDDKDTVRKGWVNVGTHSVLIELDPEGQLTVEVCARTNEGQALGKAIVTKAASVEAGGVDPDCEDDVAVESDQSGG